ncbi:MAG: M48 family metallopeptidase [Clostridium sp.]|nr:M48 family metallopeptidase [Clostridium sp.]
MKKIDYEVEETPIRRVNIGFGQYIEKRRRMDLFHEVNGIPDYAFALDYELREKLKKIPGFYEISKKLCATATSRAIQQTNVMGLAVGPNQFNDIYEMGVDCAKRLGIGIPNIFIINDPTMNAYTYASDNVAPIIVLHSGIIERMTKGEVKCVIAHECGHIHNEHALYQVLAQHIGNTVAGIGNIGAILSTSNMALLHVWTRAGEITADRAALICADDVNDAISVDKKLLYGATLGTQVEINIEAIRKQLDMALDNPMANLVEILSDHPGSLRRIVAEMEFEECDIFYKWRPELKKSGQLVRSKEETDTRCKKIVNVFMKG